MTRVVILGRGKMGRMVAELAPAMGFEVVARLGAADTANGLTREAVAGAEVAIEFTVPTAAAMLVRACADLSLPVVSGTTGWDAERTAAEAHVREHDGALLWAPNFALGMHLFAKVVQDAARRFVAAGFTARMTETHHTKKLDAPSGTARMLAGLAERASGKAVPITSVRTGEVPGTHEFFLEGAFEEVRLVHEAKDRRVFASGALAAARWLVGRRGVFTLDDYLGEVSR